MKLMVARVGAFRGWILVAGLGLMVTAVALVGGSKGLAKKGPALGLAPAVAQQSSASEIDASPLMKRIQSIAQAPRLGIIKERLAPLAPALAPSAAALMPFAPVTITLDAIPISGSAVAQGDVIAYAIEATNAQSSDTTVGANGFVRIIDTAPAGTLFTNATIQQQPQFGSAWHCSILGGGTSIECHAGDGTGAGVDTFTTQEFVKIRAEVTVQAATANGATLTNTATFQFDNDGGGLEETATSNSVIHVVNPTADLGITKVTSNTTPTAGGAAFSYTVTVTNNGPNSASDVIVSDPLPPGIIFQNVSVVMNPVSPTMTCTGPPVGTNGTIICNSANFPNGQSAVITIFGQVVPNVASVARTNTATVTSGTPEPVPNVFPNTGSVTQDIVVDAPLSITEAGPATVCAGDTLTYHVTVLNGGSSTALAATISDPLPANTTFLSLSGTGGFTTGCSFNGGTPGSVTCAAVDIPTGLSTLDITVKLAPSAPSGSLGNTATITTAGTGTIAVGTSSTTATVNHCSDLEITKDDSPDTVSPGQDINYAIKVRNVGPSNIASGEFVVNDPTFPPTGTTLKTGTTINAPGFNCNGGVTFPCTATSTLAAGATAVLNYSVTVNPDFNVGQPGGFVVNTATVSIIGGSNATDSIPANNSSTTNTPVNPRADLSITNTAETLAGGIFGASVTAGGTIAGTLPAPVTGTGEILYTLTYRNNGPGDATNVHVRDDIPAGTLLDPTFLPIGVVVTPAAGPGLTCQILPTLNNYQLDCTPNTVNAVLPAAANGTIQFRVRVPENIADGTVIRNQPTLNSEGIGTSPGSPDPNGGNNTSNETQNIVRTSADLAIGKTGPASVTAGNNITYTLTVTNNGPSDALSVLVKDTLPPNISFVSLGAGSDPRFACQPDNGNAGIVNCTAATLIAPAVNSPPIIPPRSGSNTATITIVGRVNAGLATGTILSNSASVSTSTQDPVPANNAVGPVNTTVTNDASLSITKAGPATVCAGDTLTYHVTVLNGGSSTALNAAINDPLPANTTFLSLSGTGGFTTGCSFNGGTPGSVTCAAVDIPTGLSTLDITVKLSPTAPSGSLANTATITTAGTGTIAVGTSTTTATVNDCAASDMGITKATDNATPTAGGAAFKYTLTVNNSGPGAGKDVVVTDALPAGVLFQSLSVAGGGSGLSCAGPGVGSNGPVICNSANFPVGSVAIVTINAQMAANAAAGVSTNTATVTSGSAETVLNVNPNTASVQQTVQVNAPLSISETGPATVCQGGVLIYQITVNNSGVSTAQGVTISDPLPANTTFVSASGTKAFANSCSESAPGTVTCAGVDVPSGLSTLAVTVQLAADAPTGNLSNTASITNPGTGTVGVGTATTTAAVNACSASDMGITKIVDNANPIAGGAAFMYTLTVNNSGPGAGKDVVVTDALPAGVLFQSLSVVGGGSGLSCAGPGVGSNGPVICTSANFPVGSVATVTINAQIAANAAAGVRTNTATVTSGTAETVPNVNPNTASVQQTVQVNAPLSITETGPATVCQGGVLNYQITVNNSGLSTAQGVTISDPLPANTTFMSASGTKAFANSCSESAPGTVTCAGVDVPSGLSTLTVTLQLAADAPTGNLSNTASITNPGTGTVGVGTATSTAVVNACSASDMGITKATDNANPIAGGAGFTYTLTVNNSGPGAGKDVVVTDALPAGVLFQSLSVVGGGSGLSCAGPGVGSNGPVICTSANFPVGSVATVTINAQIAANAAAGVRTNTATVTSGTAETVPNVNPNTASAQQAVQVNAPLSITETGPGTACPGDTFTYHITVNNGGNSTTKGVTISDPLPPNTTFLSVSGTGGLVNACSHNGSSPGTVTCFGDLPSGQSTVDIRVALAAGAPNGVLANTATITNAGTGTIAVGTATASTTVGCSTVLSISPTTVTEGTGGTTSATFTVTLAAASTQTVTVDYLTLDGTASAPSDYTAQAGTLTFAPGVTTRNILVPIMTDSLPEPTETFLVTLFNPSNATIGTAQGTGTINDDDASGVFQFSAATANVNENAVPGSINLTINRTGDTTGVASVNFETNDITALQKTDYTFNSGNVQFGPGVTSKTVNLLIVNDALVEGPETFWVSLFNASGNFVVNGNNSILVTINDDDVVPGANSIDSAGSFVRQQYLDFLGREPDPSGLAFWTNQITLCGADPACILERRVNVSGAFFLSIEFQETSGNVIRSQRVAFGRQSEDPATRISYLQFMRDTRQVGAGVIVGQGGYEAVLEANKQAYAQQVVSSPAFNARFPFSPAATYVDALYASAGVTPTAAERTAAINAFGAGAAPGRIAAFRSVADSATLRTAEFTTSFVLAEYFGYLRRNPTDAPDFNDAGYQFWLTKLNLFNGDFQRAEMVKAFITSLEDRGRFGTP